MGDGLKLCKDKRHRSSSSIAGVCLDGTRSERKLDIRVSIPEVDDQFAVAEARCNDLQNKIDFVKVLKRKKKAKRRSSTRINEQTSSENVPFISVRAQPKKKVTPQAARFHRLDVPMNPVRGYLDPATIEQHRMIGQVKGYNQNYTQPRQPSDIGPIMKKSLCKFRSQRNRAEGDGRINQIIAQNCSPEPVNVGVGQEENNEDRFETEFHTNGTMMSTESVPKSRGGSSQFKLAKNRRRISVPPKTSNFISQWSKQTIDEGQYCWDGSFQQEQDLRHQSSGINPKPERLPAVHTHNTEEDRPVVELFNKERISSPISRSTFQNKHTEPEKKVKKRRETQKPSNCTIYDGLKPAETKKDWHPRIKYRSRRYELPTVASQMKQSGVRYYYEPATNHTNLPFVVSKSTAPSHNIGVNIQQVLNGMKIQQPLSGIPLTIAHHMGLGHISSYNNSATKSSSIQVSLDNREINAIKLGQRLLRLPSYKYMSYSRLLNLYREGDGMVPRFLRAISRPHYFYTSMYNLATNRDDLDGATSKGQDGSQEAKQSLAEYASLYREFEQIEKCINEGNYDTNYVELERRREELSKELALREEHIRKVVQEYKTGPAGEQSLRAASTTDDYRHSSFKLNVGGDH